MNKKNLCILPWISLDRNADTSNPSFAPCCLYQTKKEFYNFDEYWSSNELNSVRQKMLNGERPDSCWKCWHDEDAGKKSMRQSVNESRLEPHFDQIKNDIKKPLQVKLLAGASCNLACRMCQSHVSSKVFTVWESIGMPTQKPYAYDHVSDALIRDHADTVRYIDLMGGEPLYNKKVHKLIQWLVDNNHASHITIYLTTNGMILNENLIDNLNKFEKVVCIVSLDAVGKKHEYIRPGSDWNTILKNIKLLQANKMDVIVQPVISAINILCLPELEDWCSKEQLHMTQKSLVHNPEQLHPKNLPTVLKKYVDKKYSAIINEQPSDSAADFIQKLDKHWNTDITDFMPEWQEVFHNNNEKTQLEKDYDLYQRGLAFVNTIK